MKWQEYLKDAKINSKIPDYIKGQYDFLCEEINKIREHYNKYIEPFARNVFEIEGPKTIIKEKTKLKAKSKGYYGKYSFRFVCLTTGRKSHFIKIKDYPKYGILISDIDTGGNYRTYEQIEKFLVDKITPLRNERDNKCKPFTDKLRNISNEIYNYNITYKGEWFNRYNEYLLSEEWSRKRNLILKEDNYNCCICGTEHDLQVHHIHYNNVGNEHLDDCITLCKHHHIQIHDMSFSERKDIELKCLNKRQSNVNAGITYVLA